MFNDSVVLTSALAFAAALLIAFALTPVVKSFAYRIGAVDVPKDNRRMHKTPVSEGAVNKHETSMNLLNKEEKG